MYNYCSSEVIYIKAIGTIMQDKGFDDLKPIDIGTHRCPPKHSWSGVRQNYLIHYVVSGKGELICPKGTFSLKAGEIFIICPDEYVVYTADSVDPWEYIYVNFSGKTAARLNEIKNPVRKFDSNAFLLLASCADYGETKEEYVVSCLFLIMSELFKDKKSRVDYVETVISYISANYSKNLKVEEISSSLGLNRHYLSRLFKSKKGLSIKSYIVKTRMEAAKKYLTAGYSVGQTALFCGYSDQFNFSKMYKQYYKSNPSRDV